MKLSEIIIQSEQILKTHGDMEIFADGYGHSYFSVESIYTDPFNNFCWLGTKIIRKLSKTEEIKLLKEK